MSEDKKKKESHKLEIIIAILIILALLLIVTIPIALRGKTKVGKASGLYEGEGPTTAKEAQMNVLNYQVLDSKSGLVKVDDGIYRRKSGITNLLFIGLDNQSPANADFLMMASFDETDGYLNMIEINPMLNVQGTTDYSSEMGMTIAESAQLGIDNLIQQCSHLFYGSVIDYYIAMNMEDTAALLVNLGIADGSYIVETDQRSQKMARIGYGKQFIDYFMTYIKESKFDEEFLKDTWGFIEEHSQNNAKIEEMGQLFALVKVFEIRRAWDTPALEFFDGYNIIKPENKNLVINTFFSGVQY